MTLEAAASVAQSFLGISIDQQGAGTVKKYRTGHPYLHHEALADPADELIPVDGGAGLITGTVEYCLAIVDRNHGKTLPTAWSSSLTITTEIATVTPFDISTYGAGFLRAEIYRRHLTDDGVTYTSGYLVGKLYDTTLDTWDDNLPTDSPEIDYSLRPPTSNTTGSTFGFRGIPFDSHTLDRDAKRINSAEVGSGIGTRPGFPGPISIGGTLKQASRAGFTVPLLAAGLGSFTKQGVAAGVAVDDGEDVDEDTKIYTFLSSNARVDTRSLSAFAYPGGSVDPMILLGLILTGFDLSLDEGKLADFSYELLGTNFSVFEPSEEVSGSGTWFDKYNAILRGEPGTQANLYDLYEKITAISGNNLTAKLGLGSAPTGAITYPILKDGSDHKQTKRTLGATDWEEVSYTDGSSLAARAGLDTGAQRLPLEVMHPGPLNIFAVNDLLKFRRAIRQPGAGAGQLGKVPIYVDASPYTDAHAFVQFDGGFLECVKFDCKSSFPGAANARRYLGPNARMPTDYGTGGLQSATFSFTTPYRDRTWERKLLVDSVAEVIVKLEGERIPGATTGVRSAFRESAVLTFPQVEITSVKKAEKADGDTMLVVTAAVTQQPAASGVEFMEAVVTTRENWDLP